MLSTGYWTLYEKGQIFQKIASHMLFAQQTSMKVLSCWWKHGAGRASAVLLLCICEYMFSCMQTHTCVGGVNMWMYVFLCADTHMCWGMHMWMYVFLYVDTHMCWGCTCVLGGQRLVLGILLHFTLWGTFSHWTQSSPIPQGSPPLSRKCWN